MEVYRLQEHEQKITSTDLRNYLCVTADSHGIVKVLILCFLLFVMHFFECICEICSVMGFEKWKVY
jgi:hypothetical protein